MKTPAAVFAAAASLLGCNALANLGKPKPDDKILKDIVRDYEVVKKDYGLHAGMTQANVSEGKNGFYSCDADIERIEGAHDTYDKKYFDIAQIFVDTSDGKLSVEQIKTRCKRMGTVFEGVTYSARGCVQRDIALESISLGGGHWTPAQLGELSSNTEFVACDQMPRRDMLDATSAPLAADLHAACDQKAGNQVKLSTLSTSGWSAAALRSGQTIREKTITCWAMGEFELGMIHGDAHESPIIHMPGK